MNKIQDLNIEIAELRLSRVQLELQRILEAERFILKHHFIFSIGNTASNTIKNACKFSMTQLCSITKVFLDFCIEVRKLDDIEQQRKNQKIIIIKRRYK